jgi:integrase
MSKPRVNLTDRAVRRALPRDKEFILYDLTLKSFGLRVQSTGAKSWVLRAAVNGHVKRITLGDARRIKVADARAKAYAILAEGDALDVADVKPLPHAPTFATFAKLYHERRAKHWRPSTRRTADVYLRCTLLPAFGNMPMDRIKRADVARWFHDYGKHRPGGANRALDVLRNLFNSAEAWGILSEEAVNPCRGIKKNRSAPRGRILNHEELQRLGTALDRKALIRPDQVDAIRLLLLTGCRLGEILCLRWDDVKPGRLDLSDSKTGPRRVLLGDPAMAVLTRRRQKQRQGSAYVFPRPSDPGKPRASISSFWYGLRREAGLPSTLRLHDLRHNYASHAIMEGETLIMTGKLLGHRHATTTQRYAHLSGEFLLAAADRIAEVILEFSHLEGRPSAP